VDRVQAGSMGLQTPADKIMPNGEGFGLVRRTKSGHIQVSVEHALELIMTMEEFMDTDSCGRFELTFEFKLFAIGVSVFGPFLIFLLFV